MMNCEHCGRNEATFHYQKSVNGHTEEAHLCAACAAALGYDTDFGGFDSVFSILPSMLGGIFGEPRLTGAARRTLQLTPAPDEPRYETESLLGDAESEALRRECARNSLDARLKAAITAEDYEEAARLRDERKKLNET